MPIDELTVAGRIFRAEELSLVRRLVRDYPGLSRHELAATVCELLQWERPNGRLKTRECRDLLERLSEHDALSLPPKQAGRPKGAAGVRCSAACVSRNETVEVALRSLLPIRLVLADTPQHRRLCRELLDSHHYLGARTPFGAHLRYLIQSDGLPSQTVGVLQYSSPAWRMRQRDRWIGWDEPTRKRNLQHIVNQSRFLILPWLRVHNLASHVLALSLRQLATDWFSHYGVRPVLVETLVDAQRYTGTCYRAANWIALGTTAGRGRMDRKRERQDHAPKQIFVSPLVKHAKKKLLEAGL